MRLNKKSLFLWAALAIVTVGVSCSSEDDFGTYDYDDVEQAALDQYMEGLEGVYRQADGYWIEPIDMSSKEGTASNESICWVKYNFTSRSLIGDVCSTRYESVATQQGTFNYYTYYSPYMVYLSSESTTDDYEQYYYSYYYYYEDQDNYIYNYEENDSDEYNLALNLALKSTELTIDGEVVNIYAGNKFKIYMPSALKGVYYNGYSGYAGSSTLGSYRPMVSEIEIVEVIPDATVWENVQVSSFMALNGSDDGDWEWEAPSSDYDLGVYINYSYTPEMVYNFPNQYNYGELPYYDIEGFDELESAMNEQLIDLFGVGKTDGNYVGTSDDAKIWYVLRTLDGFVVDTNISEIGLRARGSSSGCGSYITYNAEDDYADYVYAWYYAIPVLKYGSWASVLITSDSGYSYMGYSSYYSNTEIAPHTPLIFNIYIEEESEVWE